MSAHPFYFVSAAGAFVTVLVAIAGYYYSRRPRSTQTSWEELLAKLTWIDRNNLAQVALDLIDESGRPREDAANLEPSQLWKLVGGLEGLEVSTFLLRLAESVADQVLDEDGFVAMGAVGRRRGLIVESNGAALRRVEISELSDVRLGDHSGSPGSIRGECD